MIDTSKAEAKVASLERHDLLRIDTLPGGVGIVAYFASDQGLRSLGQSSLLQSTKGGFGLVIKADGKIPRDAEVQKLLWNAPDKAATT